MFNLKTIILSIFMLAPLVQASQTPWSILIYADPCADITEAVIKNIVEFTAGYESSNPAYLQLRVFLDKNPKRSYAYRFLIQNTSLIFQSEIEITGDHVTDITDAANWAFSGTNSSYQAIIFSGHGSGILEQSVNQQTGKLELEPDAAQCITCQKRKQLFRRNQRMTRSILINDLDGSSVDNTTMISIMSSISNILGKKIDLVGFDLCMGASVEHAYQLAPYVHYLVGVQNCALADGFNFYPFAKEVQNSNSTPDSLAQSLVTSFQQYYQHIAPEQHYTLSALDCCQAPALAHALDDTAQQLIDLLEKYSNLKEAIMDARSNSFHACIVPMYTDLYQVLDLILQNVTPLITADEATQLTSSIATTQSCLKNLVYANVTGYNINFVHGASIYFPYSHIDSSYYKTLFAQNSAWMKFLKIMTKE